MKLRLSGLLALLAAFAAVPAPAPAACREGVEYRDVFYGGIGVEDRPDLGRRLRDGVVPGCTDTVHIGPDGNVVSEPAPDTPVRLRRIRGVPARIAVARPDRREVVYLAPGFLAGLASHPLHEAIFGPRGHDLRRGAGRCDAESTFRGMVDSPPTHADALLLAGPNGATYVMVDRRTRVRGAPLVAGTPRFAQGDAVTADGRQCDNYFLARRIVVSPAG